MSQHPTEPEASGPSETIRQWRERRGYSSATFYKMKRRGLAPEILDIPGFNSPRITARADREWEKRMAELAKENANALERQRRIDHARHAGQAAAKSPDHISNRRKKRTAQRGAP